MDPITFAQLNEAYHKGVYGQEETLDIQEWVEALIEEGYDLDQYTDEELYEAYLDEVKGGGKVDPHNPDPSRGMEHSPYVKAGIKQVGIENQTIHRENEIRRKHKAPRVDPWEDPSDPDYREPPLRVMQATNRANRAAATDPKMLRLNKRYQKIGNVMDNMKENLDLYDLVSEYLVSEGFCDSYEDADVIMANMSEEWRDGILSKYQFIENVSSGNAKRASFGRISQRVTNSEINNIKNNPSLLDKRKKAENEKIKKRLAIQQEPVIKHKKELENLSNQNPRGGVSGEKRTLTRRNINDKRVKETPRNRAKRTGENIETVPLHLRKTPKEHESGRRRLNILRALRDPYWGTPAANYDWRQERRSTRSERLGLNKEEYEYLINYILNKSYAETLESADVIMANMSEEWREIILDEALSNQ